jgi:tripartite-type tricarboxylate transporter receptor subunit TctC
VAGDKEKNMKVRHRNRWLLAVGASVGLLATACGTESGGDGAGAGTEAATATTADDATEATTDPETEFPTQNITWIVPYSPGGGFDTYARGLAEHMRSGGHLPNDVNIVIENITPLPEGISRMYNADADGHTIGILPMPAAIAQEIQFPDLAQWETREFSVVGSVDENAYVIYVEGDGPYEAFEDLQSAPDLRSITVEKGSTSSLAAVTAIETLGLDAKISFGAEGSQEAATSLLRGDVDFLVYGTTDLTGFVESGDIQPVLFLGTEDQRTESIEWLADLPGLADAGHPDAAGAVTELRAIVAPPDVPEAQLGILRQALADTMADPAFQSWAEESSRPLVPRDADSARGAMQDQIKHMEELVPRLVDQGLL